MDKQTFGERVRACQTKMYRVSISIMKNHADAEDAAAEAVMKAWEKRGSLRNEEFFETWLIRILINICREALRKQKAHPVAELTEDIPSAPREEETEVRRALMRVEEKYRLPLVMHAALGMTVAAVARALNIPVGVARWRIERGRRLARIEMEREEEET